MLTLWARKLRAAAVFAPAALVAVLEGRPEYIMARVRGNSVWHRVRVGRFGIRNRAEALRRTLPKGLGEAVLVG